MHDSRFEVAFFSQTMELMASSNRPARIPGATAGEPIEAPTIVFVADGCVMALWLGIAIVIWGTQATPTLTDQLARLAEQAGRTHARISIVTLVLRGTPPPTPAARDAFKALTNQWAARLVCSATLIEERGFWASAIRSLLTGLDLWSGRRFKLRAFDDIRALAEWAVPQHAAALNLTLEPVDFVRVVESLRAHDRLMARPS